MVFCPNCQGITVLVEDGKDKITQVNTAKSALIALLSLASALNAK